MIGSLRTPLAEQSTIKVSRISSAVVIFHSFLKQKDAIWSLCVVCIICSALTMHIYTARGLLYMEYYALPDKSPDCWSTRKDAGIFVSKGDKIAYTEKEKAALAVFTFVVICSVTEIVLAVAMMKISERATPQLCSSCGRYDEVLCLQYLPRIVPFEVSVAQ